MSELARNTILCGDNMTLMRQLPDACVSMCVTSPPYFALRDYGVEGQIGLEATPELFIARLVEVFQEVRRILHPSGTCWVNMGDSYAGSGKGGNPADSEWKGFVGSAQREEAATVPGGKSRTYGFKQKDLMGIPWQLAFALRADGWYLRSDIIWHKLNPMPESVTDRPTKAHEYLFLLSKSKDYFYDAEPIKEAGQPESAARYAYAFSGAPDGVVICPGDTEGRRTTPEGMRVFDGTRNRRTVWTVATAPYAEAHFATYPPKLIEPCILAGTSERGCCPKCYAPWERTTERKQLTRERPNDYTKRTGANGTGNSCANSVAGVSVTTTGWQPTCKCNESSTVPGIVFDPFGGSGTTGQVARALGRDYLLCELNPAYIELAEKRVRTPLYGDAPKVVQSSPGQRTMFEEGAA